MATGRLGTADLSATTNTTVYTCPTNTFAVVAVNICNRTASPVTVRMAVSDGAVPLNGEYIEFDATVAPNNVLERTGVVLASGQNVVVRSSAASVSCVVMGIETATV